MKIGIFTNEDKDKDFETTKLLISKLQQRGVDVLLPSSIAALIRMEKFSADENYIAQNANLVISLGGDGTLLRVARKVSRFDTPIIGINIGNLGFLAENNVVDIDSIVDSLVNSKYKVEDRMILEANVHSENFKSDTFYALNDVVIGRSNISRIININTYIDDNLLDRFPADGIIVATPTGSTAYSMSAGGPIVEPDMKLIIITPICPHVLHARPWIISDKKQIQIQIDNKSQNDCMLTIDGQENHPIENAHWINIKKSEHSLKIIKITDKNFFDIVKGKLVNRK